MRHYSHYAALGATPCATQADLRKARNEVICHPAPLSPRTCAAQAYLAACARWHPDKNPSPEAAATFHRICAAYAVLVDPVLRDEYDEQGGAAEGGGGAASAAIETGDAAFATFEQAQAHSGDVELLSVLAELEGAYGIAEGSLRGGAAAPCLQDGGQQCSLALVEDKSARTLGRLLVCTAHSWAHRCGPRCCGPQRACPLWAAYLGNRYRAEVAAAWSLQTTAADDPERPGASFWFNARAGVSEWAAPDSTAPSAQLTTVHQCSRAQCQRTGFTALDDGVWVCRASSTVHVCTPTQCRWNWQRPADAEAAERAERLRATGRASKAPAQAVANPRLCCWASGRATDAAIGDDADFVDLHAGDRPAGREPPSAGQKRLVSFRSDTTGRLITQMVPAPFGAPEPEAPGAPSAPTLAGARKLIAFDTVAELARERAAASSRAREEDELAVQELKRSRGYDAGEGDAVDEAPDAPPPADKRPRVAAGAPKPRGTARARQDTGRIARLRQELREQSARWRALDFDGAAAGGGAARRENEDDVYTVYGAGILDHPDQDRDDAGDYMTAYTKAGGIEGTEEADEDEFGVGETDVDAFFRRAASWEGLKARDPNEPIIWMNEPIGELVDGHQGDGFSEVGTIRVYDGQKYRMAERPPFFPLGAPPILRKGECQLSVSHESPRIPLPAHLADADIGTRRRALKNAILHSPFSQVRRAGSPAPSAAESAGDRGV